MDNGAENAQHQRTIMNGEDTVANYGTDSVSHMEEKGGITETTFTTDDSASLIKEDVPTPATTNTVILISSCIYLHL